MASLGHVAPFTAPHPALYAEALGDRVRDVTQAGCAPWGRTFAAPSVDTFHGGSSNCVFLHLFCIAAASVQPALPTAMAPVLRMG